MAWRDDLLQGSLGGVPFFFEDIDTTVGRRTKVHEFHGDRDAWPEDIGPVTKRFRLNIFLVGEDYNVQRQRLNDVLDTPGPYELVHPTFGLFTVRTETPTQLRETRAEGGIVRIGSLSLVRVGLEFPLIFESEARLKSLGELASEALAANTSFSILGAIDTVIDSIRGGLFAATSRVRKINSKIGGALNTVDQVTAQIREFEGAIDTLIQTPSALMSSLNGLLLTAFNAVSTFVPPDVLVSVDEFEFPVVGTASGAVSDSLSFETAPGVTSRLPADSVQGQIDATAHGEITIQIQTSGIIAGSALASDLPFDSASQAKEYLEILSDGYDAVLDDLPPETVAELRTLKAATVDVLRDRQAQLPRITTVTPPQVSPALVLAFQLYGDAQRSREIVRRNRVRHPGFVPDEPLEVVVDA